MGINNPQIKLLIREKREEFVELVREISENAIVKDKTESVTPERQMLIEEVQDIAAKKLAKKYGYDFDDEEFFDL